ncbi:MAG TPA: apolipoprotein N-acyltransferase [Polyangiaceae bacterium]|jgi:apolipoprotein N-acyltransferase
MTRVRTYAFCLLAGAILATASPPFDVFPALWLGMAALAWRLYDDPAWPLFASRTRVALTGARRGLAFGVGANLVALRFVPGVVAGFTPLPWAVGALGLLLLAAFEGSRWMLAAVASETLARARVPRPVAFAAGVYAGTFVPTMMPWTPAGGVSPWPAMVQLADVVGERGVTAIMALAAGLLAAGVNAARERESRRRGALLVGGAVVVVAAQAVFGRARMASVERVRLAAPHVEIGLVQPSVGASTRWDPARAPVILDELRTLTKRAEARGADVVVWHEAAYPFPVPHGARSLGDAAREVVGDGVRGPVITGLLTTGAADGASYNSAAVVRPDGSVSPTYDKRHLLWFGETVPLADRIPWLRSVFARGLGLAAGDREVALTAGPVHAAVLVCYEDMLPEAGREAMDVAPNLLVNVTNDAWFRGSSESELHLRVATLRAVELRRDMVRAVNFGPTSWVDAAGRVRARALPDVPSVLIADPALLDGAPSLYARWGDAPWALLALVLANVAVWRRARHA